MALMITSDTIRNAWEEKYGDVFVGKTKGNSINKAPIGLWKKEDSSRGELARKDPKAAIEKYAVGGEHYVVTKSPIKKVFVKPLNRKWKKKSWNYGFKVTSY